MSDIQDDPFALGAGGQVDLPNGSDTDAKAVRGRVAELADLDPLDYEVQREAEARALGIRVSVLDRMVREARPRQALDDEPPELIEEHLEPWPDEVVGASLAEEVRERLTAHVAFASHHDATAAALWILGTYLMDVWRVWPRIMVTSPEKGCGKSTLCEVIEAMAHRGLYLSSCSAAGVFRAIETWKPTLVLDETDTWMTDNPELTGILNSGHTRRQAKVIRVEEIDGERKPVAFSTWTPMVISGIGGQRDTLESRSIIISLRRRLSGEAVERMPKDLHAEMLRMRRQALRWARDNARRIEADDAEPPESGDDRRRDNFTPLWRIAGALGEPWPERLAAGYHARSEAAGDDDETAPAAVMLLRDLWYLFGRDGEDRLGRTYVLGEIRAMEDRPWAEWRHGKPATAHTLTKLLKPYGVQARKVRFRGGEVQGYLRDQVEDAFRRYASAPTPENFATLPQANENNELGEKFSATGIDEKHGFATSKPRKNKGNGNVAENSPPVAGEGARRRCLSVGGRPLNGYGGLSTGGDPDEFA